MNRRISSAKAAWSFSSRNRSSSTSGSASAHGTGTVRAAAQPGGRDPAAGGRGRARSSDRGLGQCGGIVGNGADGRMDAAGAADVPPITRPYAICGTAGRRRPCRGGGGSALPLGRCDPRSPTTPQHPPARPWRRAAGRARAARGHCSRACSTSLLALVFWWRGTSVGRPAALGRRRRRHADREHRRPADRRAARRPRPGDRGAVGCRWSTLATRCAGTVDDRLGAGLGQGGRGRLGCGPVGGAAGGRGAGELVAAVMSGRRSRS